MNKKILIVSYHFFPDAAIGARRTSKLARFLKDNGCDVTVVCAGSAHDMRTDPALEAGVADLRRIALPLPPRLTPPLLRLLKRLRRRPADGASAPAAAAAAPVREGPLQRLKRYYHSLEFMVDDRKLWSLRVMFRLWSLGPRESYDAVISSGPPMSPHIAVLFSRLFLRCPWIMDLRDPWRDNGAQPGVQSALSRGVSAFFERRCVRSATVVTTTTPGLMSVLRQRYPERADAMRTIFNGYDGSPETQPAPSGRLRLLYAGSIYFNRNPFPLLEALEWLLERPEVDRSKVSFLLVGHCQSWRERDIPDWIRRHGMDDCIQVRPPVPQAQVRQLMREANVLVNFAQGQPQQIPAKLFEYLEAGREMLLIAEEHSDSATLVRDSGSGRICDPSRPEALREALLGLYRHYVIDGAGYRFEPARCAAYGRAGQNARFAEAISAAREEPAPALQPLVAPDRPPKPRT